MEAFIMDKLAAEAAKLFGGNWRTAGGDQWSGPNWAVASSKESQKASFETPIGPKPKRNYYYAIAIDKTNGEMKEKTWEVESKSWKDNANKAFPQINAWVTMVSGTNPNLAW